LHYGYYLLLPISVGIGGLLVAIRRSRKRVVAKSRMRPLSDYILLWPLLFRGSSNDQSESRGRHLFSSRELIGWALVLMLMALAIVFEW
jgi:hypothetical protein